MSKLNGIRTMRVSRPKTYRVVRVSRGGIRL